MLCEPRQLLTLINVNFEICPGSIERRARGKVMGNPCSGVHNDGLPATLSGSRRGPSFWREDVAHGNQVIS